MSRQSLSVSGLIIAVIGFVLTRFTVTLAAMDSTREFFFAGIVPLVLGLSLAAFGVILTVGAYDTAFVRTTTLWCVLGTVAMGFLVALTIAGSQPQMVVEPTEMRQQTLFSNFMIGGAVGGTLTGLYAAQNRRHRRDLRQQANRLILLNRLLRDQVINAATAIRGHTDVLTEGSNEQSVRVIGDQADKVIDIVENVRYLSGTADKSDLSLGPVDVVDCIQTELAEVRKQYPDADCEFSPPNEQVSVRANTQLGEVFRHLILNAIEYSDAATPRVTVELETSRKGTTVSITDNGPGLPKEQQELLESGAIAEFDDPTTGFGLNIVRLLVEGFEGDISTTVTEDGSTIAVELPRIERPENVGVNSGSLTAPGVAPSQIALAVSAALIAGVTMGIVMQMLGGTIPVIGGLYGVQDPVVGVITHEFHSVVFGLVYVGILSAAPLAYTRGLFNRLGISIALGIVLWLFAAGIIMPMWLQLVGIQAPLPNLTLPSFVGHIVWSLTLAPIHHFGEGYIHQNDTIDRFDSISIFDKV